MHWLSVLVGVVIGAVFMGLVGFAVVVYAIAKFLEAEGEDLAADSEAAGSMDAPG